MSAEFSEFARRVGVTTETMTMIALVQMVSIFGFGLGVLVARCSVNPENLSPQPMLMAMIAVTRRYGRVTFPASCRQKSQDALLLGRIDLVHVPLVGAPVHAFRLSAE